MALGQVMAEQLQLQWEAPRPQLAPRPHNRLHEAFHGLERRVFASQEAGLAMRAELAQLVPPATLFELDRRAPPRREQGDPIIISDMHGPGMLTRGVLHPLEQYWKQKLEAQREGRIYKEMKRLVWFSQRTHRLRGRVLAQVGPELYKQFADECKETLQEDLLTYWRRRWFEVRVLYLVAEFCDHEWLYRGWWMYEREAPDQVRDDAGDYGWLRSGAAAVEDYCRLIGVDDLPAIEGDRWSRPRDPAFIEAFAKRFPQGLAMRESGRGAYHRPDCFRWSGELVLGESCRCGAKKAYVPEAPIQKQDGPTAEEEKKTRKGKRR